MNSLRFAAQGLARNEKQGDGYGRYNCVDRRKQLHAMDDRGGRISKRLHIACYICILTTVKHYYIPKFPLKLYLHGVLHGKGLIDGLLFLG